MHAALAQSSITQTFYPNLPWKRLTDISYISLKKNEKAVSGQLNLTLHKNRVIVKQLETLNPVTVK